MFSTKVRWIKIAESEKDLESKLMGKASNCITANSMNLLLIHHQNKFRLVKNKCPHQGIKLDHAKCEDGMIVCPWHHYAFDLETGRGGGLYLDNYPIEFRENGVYAGFEYFSIF